MGRGRGARCTGRGERLWRWPRNQGEADISPAPCVVHRRALRTRGGSVIVRDPLSAWGTTAKMNTRDLLDAVDRAGAATVGMAAGESSSSSSSPAGRRGAPRQRVLWERLSCRAQALLPEFTAPELCRLLFAFHRARYRDEGLLDAACEAVLTEPLGERGMLGNDAALLLKALARHRHTHLPALDHLLWRAAEQCDEGNLTASDVSQLLAAVVRLGAVERLRPENLDERLFAAARARLGDAYLPAQDFTNLCAAAVLCRPSEEGARLLEAAARRFEGPSGQSVAALTPPRDVVRRLLSFGAFDAALEDQKAQVTPLATRLGPPQLAAICRSVARGLTQRASEMDPETCVAACEAMANLLPRCQRVDSAFWEDEFGPVVYLALQRLRGMTADLQRRLARTAPLLVEVCDRQRAGSKLPAALAELSAALHCLQEENGQHVP